MASRLTCHWIKAFALLLAALAGGPASAFGNCDRLIEREFIFPTGEKGTLIDDLGFEMRYDVAAEDLDIAETVTIRRDPKTTYGFFPVAVAAPGQGRQILVPDVFTKVACHFAMTYFLYNDQGRTLTKGLTEAVPIAQRCKTEGRAFLACIQQFANVLAVADAPRFEAMEESKKRLAERFFMDAMYLILSHEMAHHVLGHLPFKENTPAKDMEFEADFYAIMAALQSSRTGHSLAYIFDVMDYFYQAAGYQSSPQYETLTCRSANGSDVMTAVGFGILFMDRVVTGQRSGAAASKEGLMKAQREGDTFYDPQNNGCGQLRTQMLGEARAEANRVVTFLVDNYDAFNPHGEAVETQRPGIAFAGLDLVREYEALIGDTKHLNLLVSDSLSMYLQRLTQSDGFAMSDADKARVLTQARGEASSRSYGRILASFSYGSHDELQNNLAIRDSTRSALAEAVRFNPALTEAWTQLGMVAVMDKRCEDALRHFARGFFTARPQEMKRELGGIFEGVRGWIDAGDPRCAS